MVTRPRFPSGVFLPQARGHGKRKYHPLGVLPEGEIPCWGISPWGDGGRSARLERGHHVAREPAELLLELLRREALGPMDHEVLEPGILGRDRLDPVDHVRRRPTEPRLLLDAVGERRHARGCARRTPRAAVLVGVAHEPERREPLVALIVRRLDTALGLLGRVGQIEPGAPDHVLTELLLTPVLRARV